MNKKERFCDVDNILEWRHIITVLLALVAMAGQGQVKCHVIGTVAEGTTPIELRIYRDGEDPKNGYTATAKTRRTAHCDPC